MSVTEDNHWFEAELEQCKQNLQEDLAQMATRLHQTRVRLRPESVLGAKPLPLLGIGVLLGLLLGYWNIPFQDIGQPLARDIGYCRKTNSRASDQRMKKGNDSCA